MKWLIFSLLLLLPAAAWAADPCPFTPTAAINTEVARVLQLIQTRQDHTYATSSIGRPAYTQLLEPVIVADGLIAQPHGTRTPSDNTEKVPSDFGFVASDNLFASYRVDVYTGPRGDGYFTSAILRRGAHECWATAAQGGKRRGGIPYSRLGGPFTWYAVNRDGAGP